MAAMWKNISSAEEAKYEKLAKHEKLRRANEMAQWRRAKKAMKKAQAAPNEISARVRNHERSDSFAPKEENNASDCNESPVAGRVHSAGAVLDTWKASSASRVVNEQSTTMSINSTDLPALDPHSFDASILGKEKVSSRLLDQAPTPASLVDVNQEVVGHWSGVPPDTSTQSNGIAHEAEESRYGTAPVFISATASCSHQSGGGNLSPVIKSQEYFVTRLKEESSATGYYNFHGPTRTMRDSYYSDQKPASINEETKESPTVYSWQCKAKQGANTWVGTKTEFSSIATSVATTGSPFPTSHMIDHDKLVDRMGPECTDLFLDLFGQSSS